MADMSEQDSKPDFDGKVRSRLCTEIIHFEKEIMGRGPEEVKAYIIDDMVILRLRGVLTKAEMNLLEHNASEEERMMIKDFRHRLIEKNRHHLDEMVREVLGCGVKSVHTDLSTQTAERIIILVLDTDSRIDQG
jgi:uncharacterized protein YbcI